MTDKPELTAEEIEALRKLEAAATPSPWSVEIGLPDEWWLSDWIGGPQGGHIVATHHLAPRKDGELICAARNALPRLLSAFAAARAELAARERRIAVLEERLQQNQRGRAYDRVVEDIKSERELQDYKWGGPEHDDTHKPEEWQTFIVEHARRAVHAAWGRPAPGDDYRQQMIRVAALAVAAVESEDRRAALAAEETKK